MKRAFSAERDARTDVNLPALVTHDFMWGLNARRCTSVATVIFFHPFKKQEAWAVHH